MKRERRKGRIVRGKICQACRTHFDGGMDHFLCRKCVRKAFRDKVCPFCGDAIPKNRNKPSCRKCANAWGKHVVGPTIGRKSNLSSLKSSSSFNKSRFVSWSKTTLQEK